MSKEEGKIFSFIWKIENYSYFSHENGQKLSSPEFTAENAGGSRWCVELFPKGCDEESQGFVSCFLTRCKDNLFHELSDEILINFCLDIIGGDDQILASFPAENKTIKIGDRAGCNCLVKTGDLKSNLENCHEDIIKVRCSISSFKLIATQYEARTTIPICSSSFDWMVSVSARYANSTQHTVYITGKRFQVSMIITNTDFVIKVSEMDKGYGPYTVSFDAFLLNLKGRVILKKRDVHLVRQRNDADVWEFNFIAREKVENDTNIVNQNGQFTVSCKFSISLSGQSSNIVNAKYETSSSVCSLQKDLQGLYLNKKHPDVKLQTDNQIFPAHMALLAARSPVFSVMFDQEMTESQTGIVLVPDVDPKILDNFLQFLYTGLVPELDFESALKLHILADKYEVSSLNDLCSSYLKSKLSVENVCEVLTLSDMINNECLKTSAMDYLANHAAEVMVSPTWVTWIENNSKLTSEVFINIASTFNNTLKKSNGV